MPAISPVEYKLPTTREIFMFIYRHLYVYISKRSFRKSYYLRGIINILSKKITSSSHIPSKEIPEGQRNSINKSTRLTELLAVRAGDRKV